MSEYQYYEFQAIDRPLTKPEMAELRALTSRATITPRARSLDCRSAGERKESAAGCGGVLCSPP